MTHLYDKLKGYAQSGAYPFHMPGHKRNGELFSGEIPYHLDITEIDGFDNLHIPQGILAEAQERAATLFHAERSYFLVGGSTVGILSAILGSVDRGGQILLGPDCHKAVYHAVELGGLRALSMGERQGFSALADTLEQKPEIKAVVLTSPTYEGWVANVKRVAELVHERGRVLIVDEAHGAHLGFHPYFPENSNQAGADVVIQSLHKNLPALTQTAILHINGDRARREQILNYLHMLETSSPSYLLMASMDECVRLLTEQGDRLFEMYAERLKYIRAALSDLQVLCLDGLRGRGEPLCPVPGIDYAPGDLYPAYDPGKLVLSLPGQTGRIGEVYTALSRRYQLQMEMMGPEYLVAMTSLADRKEGFLRLEEAVRAIDDQLKEGAFEEPVGEEQISRHTKEVCYRG